MSLSKFLESTKDISNHTKYSISFGISLGLQYLHSQTPPIVHRDLTCNNVLLTDTKIAKIADLGVSRIFKLKPDKQHVSMTANPGNVCHMPPESFSNNKSYKQRPDHFDKLDIFSFGNVVLHVFTQEFPIPLPHYDEEGMPLSRTEAERRQHLIDKISFPELQKFIIKCLSNKQEMRPSTNDVVRFSKHALVSPTASKIFHDEVQSLHHTIEQCNETTLQNIPAMRTLMAKLNEFINHFHTTCTCTSDDPDIIVSNVIEGLPIADIEQKSTIDEKKWQDYLKESQYIKAFSILIKWKQNEIDILQKLITTAKAKGIM